MNRFNNITKPLMWFMALLLTAFIAGCGGGSSSSTSVPSLLNSAKSIDTFSIAWSTLGASSVTGTIDQALKTIKATVPHATVLTPMIATFTASPGVSVTVDTVLQVSGKTQNDYTLPVSYNVTAADGSYSTYTALVSRDPTLASLDISPASAVVPVGAIQQFVATATYLDASTEDVTTTASWTSGDVTKATVDLHTGVATAVSVTPSSTPVVITAAIGGIGGKTATAPMTVTNAALLSLAISPASGVVAVGSAKLFTARGTYTDGSHPDVTPTAFWTSSDPTKATVGLHNGAASGVAATGAFTPVVITATIGTVSNTADLTVTGPPGPVVCTGEPNCVNLGTAANFAILTNTGITDAVGSAVITGNIGVSSVTTGASIIVTCPEISGQMFTRDATPVNTCLSTDKTAGNIAAGDMGTAYTAANAVGGGPGVGTPCPGAGGFGGQAIAPGVYTCVGVTIPTSFTLAGTGAATDIWVFKLTGALGMTGGAGMTFTGAQGALPQNVFWAVAGTVSIGAGSTLEGVVLGASSIATLAGSTVHGRLLSQAAVNLAGGTNKVAQP